MPSSLFCLWKSTKAVHNSLSFSFQYNYVILQVRHSVPRQIVRQTVSKKKEERKNTSPSPIQVFLLLQYTTIPIKISSKSSVSKTTIRYSKSQSSSARKLLSIHLQRSFSNILITSCSENQNHQTETALSGRNCNHKILNHDSILFFRNPSTFSLPCRVYTRSRTRVMEPEGREEVGREKKSTWRAPHGAQVDGQLAAGGEPHFNCRAASLTRRLAAAWPLAWPRNRTDVVQPCR